MSVIPDFLCMHTSLSSQSMIMFLLLIISLAPKLTANEAMHQLDLVDFPSHLWRKLANGLRLGGEARNFEEGIDNNDKLQRLITHWCDHEEHSWKQLVDAVVKCGQKIKARQLAGNVDATPPSELTLCNYNQYVHVE